MSKSYWFRPKAYGYGLVPISWKGWVAIVVLMAFLLLSFYINGLFTFPEQLTRFDIGRIIIDFFVILGAFHAFVHDYIDGELRFFWKR